MSKFFIQLFVSVLIGLGAAVGFSPRARGELNQTLHETKAILSDKANVSVKTAGNVKTQVNTSVSVAAQANAKASTKGNLKADTKASTSVDAKVVTGGTLIDESLSKTSPDASLKADSQAKIKTNTNSTDMTVKDKITSTLDFGLDLGK